MLCPVCIQREEREVEMIPMYDEHPNWILFCRKCDHRHENSYCKRVLSCGFGRRKIFCFFEGEIAKKC
ncbi:hypothetical protein BW897_30965 [Bacillus cereus]|uniref:Uncharacterized protein n=1 Tax=Bacillus cereus TaxID=1396 RepID=A0A1S9T8H6_BACCE|nr:hypothetical protein BW897_30965 [Bacillus cereus]